MPVQTVLKRKRNGRTGQTFLAIHMTPIAEDSEAMMTVDETGDQHKQQHALYKLTRPVGSIHAVNSCFLTMFGYEKASNIIHESVEKVIVGPIHESNEVYQLLSIKVPDLEPASTLLSTSSCECKCIVVVVVAAAVVVVVELIMAR